MPKVKHKKRIIKAARKKQLVTYKGALIRLPADFSRETLQARRNWHEIFKVMKSMDFNQDYCTQQSYHLESKADKVLPRQEKAKGVYHHQTSIIRNAKGSFE